MESSRKAREEVGAGSMASPEQPEEPLGQQTSPLSHLDPDHPKYSIAVAAELSAIPQQQLRRMEDKGLLSPRRTAGKTRRYSDNDLQHVAEINHLAHKGLNMEGIRYVLELREEVTSLRRELADLRQQLDELQRLLNSRQ